MVPDKVVVSGQHKDWVGTASADDADQNDPWTWIQQYGQITPGQKLAGLRMSYQENPGDPAHIVTVEFVLVPARSSDPSMGTAEAGQDSVGAGKNVMGMTLIDFFGLFKRFDITISPVEEPAK